MDEVIESAVETPVAAPAAAPVSAPAVATEAKVETKTEAKAEEKPGYWAADWRERLAAGDEKARKQLDRYASPEDVWKKARALEVERSSGKLKPVLAKDASPEDLAAYRKSWGIPETADKYDLAGVKLDDIDRPMMGEVMKAMHGTHASPEAVKAVVNTWAEIKKQAQDAQAKFDKEAQRETEDSLRQEWGTEYRGNINLIQQLFDVGGSQEFKDKFLSGRLEDGTPIGSSPEAMKFLLGLALVNNPSGVVVQAGSGDMAGNLKEELKKISDFRTKNRAAYNKDADMQSKERKYIEHAISKGLMDSQGNWKQ